MNVLINLLPDIRLAKQREKMHRQLFTGVALVVCAIAIGAVVILGLTTASQKLIVDGLSTKITAKISQLNSTPGLIDALTAQQRLNSLPSLYVQRVHLSKFFAAYQDASPTEVSISSLGIGQGNALTITGAAKTYAAAAKLERALEAENISIGAKPSSTNLPYFTNVTLHAVTLTSASISFSISATVATEVTNGNN